MAEIKAITMKSGISVGVIIALIMVALAIGSNVLERNSKTAQIMAVQTVLIDKMEIKVDYIDRSLDMTLQRLAAIEARMSMRTMQPPFNLPNPINIE